MRAKDLVKKPIRIEDIYEAIKSANDSGYYKTSIMGFTYMNEKVRTQLLNDGFKLHKTEEGMNEQLIIEW